MMPPQIPVNCKEFDFHLVFMSGGISQRRTFPQFDGVAICLYFVAKKQNKKTM
jgi:hypothetical protein